MKTALICSCFMLVGTVSAQEVTIDQADYNIATELYEKAKEHFDFAEYDSAALFFSQAISLNPNNSDYFFGRATSYNNLGQLDKAAKDIATAIQMEPDQADYHYFGANIFFKAKRYKEAVDNYSKAIVNQGNDDIHINLMNCYYNRGVGYLMLKNYEMAADDFTRVIEINNSFAQAFHNRGITLRNLGRMEAACADFEQAKTLGIEQSQQYINRYCKFSRGG